MTDTEIIKALECCIKDNCDCGECPAIAVCQHDPDCPKTIALSLIDRQKAEIERLHKSIELMKGAKCVYSYDGETLQYCTTAPCPICKTTDQIKAEAVKEFAERLKEEQEYHIDECDRFVGFVAVSRIDNLLKEMG